MAASSVGTVSSIREISEEFHRVILQQPSSHFMKAIHILRNACECELRIQTTKSEEYQTIQHAFETLQDEIESNSYRDEKFYFISLLIDTVILPCYRFYSTRSAFFSLYFSLFFKVISHPSIVQHENYLFSLAVIISRTSIFTSRVSMMALKDWSIESWLGKKVTKNEINNRLRFKYEKPFPFEQNSKICQDLTNENKYPLDIGDQIINWVDLSHSSSKDKNENTFSCIEDVISRLLNFQFICRSIINHDRCLSLLLDFALKRKRIVDVKIVDGSDFQSSRRLELMKKEIINRYEYLSEQRTDDRAEEKLIRNRCEVLWSDDVRFIYRSNIISARISFNLCLWKIFVYASDNEETDPSMWNYLLQKIVEIYSKSNEKSQVPDFEEFLKSFFLHSNENVRQMSSKLIRTLMKSMKMGDHIVYDPLVNSSTLGNLFRTLWKRNQYEIDRSLLDGCFEVSTSWSIEDLFHFFIEILQEFEKKFDDYPNWLDFFMKIFNDNAARYSSLLVRQSENFQKFIHRYIDVSMVKRWFDSIERPKVRFLMKQLIESCNLDWIGFLLEMFNDEKSKEIFVENDCELIRLAEHHSINFWNISSSFKKFLEIFYSIDIDHQTPLLIEFLKLLNKVFETYSIEQLNEMKFDFNHLVKSLIKIFQQFSNSNQRATMNFIRQNTVHPATIIFIKLLKEATIQSSKENLQEFLQVTFYVSLEYKEFVLLFQSIQQRKENDLFDFWFQTILSISSSIEPSQCTDENQRRFISILIDDNERVRLIEEKFQHLIQIMSTKKRISIYFSWLIQNNLSSCLRLLLLFQSNENLHSLMICLLSKALNIQSNEIHQIIERRFHQNSKKTMFDSNSSTSIVDYLCQREEKRSKLKIPFYPIEKKNFEDLIEDLKNSNSTIELRSIQPELDSKGTENSEYLIPRRTTLNSLSRTKTMMENRQRILECIQTPIHLLLEGETGVGKTSLIVDVAAEFQRPLIRLNFSSKTDVASLFGSFQLKTLLDKNGKQSIEFQFQEGPFTIAYRSGLWLLLDEMNLASTEVLQSIEEAIESGVLILSNIEEETISIDHKHLNGM